MHTLAQDLRDEGAELYEFLATLSPAQWTEPTPFKAWTPEDVLVHLLVGDWFNVVSLTAPARFEELLARRAAARAAGKITSGAEYLDEPIARAGELLQQWHTGLNNLCDLFASSDPKARIKWVGPDMSVRSSATARLMETWAHGHDVYDMRRQARRATARLRHIVVLGVKTFAWTFINRQLEPPGEPPLVQLRAPSGELWSWNAVDAQSKISGPALDFCQVVTQVRHIDDVSLSVEGEAATRWMAIAQCFAGPPEDPPAPGSRG